MAKGWDKCQLSITDRRSQWKKQLIVNKDQEDSAPLEPKGQKWDPVDCSLKGYIKHRATQEECESIGE